MKSIRIATAVFLMSSNTIAATVDDATDLAKKAQNPVEKMISVPFDNNFNFGFGPYDKMQYILNMKPVVPFSLNDSWNIITRTIIPVMHQPSLYSSTSYANGIGDINPSFFLSPRNPGRIIWGAGPTIVLPTASSRPLGQGKYSVGPSFVVLAMPKQWVIGFLTFNIWSVGGQSNRSYVNEFELQYFINYNFPHGWYLTTQPIITANWTAAPKDRWTIPFGLGGGHVFLIGKQPVNVSLQAYNNVKKPSNVGPDWQLQLNMTLLFPEKE